MIKAGQSSFKPPVAAARASARAAAVTPRSSPYNDLGATVPASIKQALQQEGAELKEVAEEEKRTSNLGGGIGGMFWRFLAIDDAGVERFIVRDADSRLNRRERFAVEEWVRSGRAVHTIRDHPSHDRHLNGGLWGAVPEAM